MRINGLTVRRRADNRWELRTQNKSFYGHTQAECVEKFKNDIAVIRKTVEPQHSGILSHDWIWQWFDTYKRKDKEHNKRCIELHILPNLPNIPINQIKQVDLINLLNDISAPRQRQYTYLILRQAWAAAMENEHLQKNIAKTIPKPAHTKNIGKSLTKDELRHLLNSIAGSKYELAIKFYLYTGCRRSEGLAVKWSDIDFVNNTLHVLGTKTISSDRVIPIFPKLKEVLLTASRNSDFVIEHTGDSIFRFFKTILPNHKLHSLRHTFASNSVNAGVSLKYVQLWLGHANYSTTADIYTHGDMEQSQIEAGKLV